MVAARFYDHKDTLSYIPKHHKTKGLTKEQVEIFKSLETRYFHEGRTIHFSFIENTNLREELAAIQFDCLLNIDEPICPRFVLEFYASVIGFIDEDDEYGLRFKINQNGYTISLTNFAQVLGIPNRGTCVYSDKWSLTILDAINDRSLPYQTPLANKDVICEHLFIPRGDTTRVTRKGKEVNRDPYGMELNELKPEFKKWEELLRANVISTIGNRDHINAYLCHMLYNLSTRQPFNLAYYIARRMIDILTQGSVALPYGMLLTRLYRAYAPIPPSPKGMHLHYELIPHIFVPLSDVRVAKTKGKRAKPPTPSSSSSSNSSEDGLPNSRLPPHEYYASLPEIENESAEFKQTKGMFKCLGRMMSKIYKKLDK